MARSEVSVLLLLTILVQMSGIQACEKGWVEFSPDGHHTFCYRVTENEASRKDHVENCRKMGAELTSIHSREEEDFLMSLRTISDSGDSSSYYTGLTRSILDDPWTNDDGTVVDYWPHWLERGESSGYSYS